MARATPPRSQGLTLMALLSCDETPVNSETMRGPLFSAWQRMYLRERRVSAEAREAAAAE